MRTERNQCRAGRSGFAVDGGTRVGRNLVFVLLASAAAFVFLLSFVPEARQRDIFRYDALCDYRKFILPSMTSGRPYFESSARLCDACYPPIAYVAVRALATDAGSEWSLSTGEIRLLLSLLLAQCVGVALLVGGPPCRGRRFAAAVAALLSPACVCTLLRGNPSGWSFALVCVFVAWHDSDDATRRIAAAVALGAATSLKLAPCLFGVLYLAKAFSARKRVPWPEISVSALSAVVLTFLPFLFFGGVSAVPQWIDNALSNSRHYSTLDPIWGVVPLVYHWVDSCALAKSLAAPAAWLTSFLAVASVVASLLVRDAYRRLLCIGAAMAFLTHHDYGGAYLIPAFVAWLREAGNPRGGVTPLLEAAAWFFVMTPLQIPNPFFSGSLNAMLQNECLFALVACAALRLCRGTGQPCRLRSTSFSYLRTASNHSSPAATLLRRQNSAQTSSDG